MPTKKWKWLFTALAAIVLTSFLWLPPLILPGLNRYLAKFSPGYSAHIDTLEIHPLRVAYQFGGVSVRAKKDDFVFLRAENIDVSLAWRKLLRLKIRTDIDVDNAQMFVDEHLYTLAKTGGREEPGEKFAGTKEDARKAKNKLFPVDVTRLSFRRSSFFFADKMGLPLDQQLHLSEIQGTITDLLPQSPSEASQIWASGLFMDSAKIKVVATAYLKEEPMEWDTDVELRHFDLKQSNDFFKRVGPLTFNNGYLDIFAEMKSEKGRLEGYVKPFLSQVDIVGNKKDFFSVKHFFVESLASLAELIFVSSKTETISTKIPISGTMKDIKVDRQKALAGVLRHAFSKEYTPQIEDSIHLKKENP